MKAKPPAFFVLFFWPNLSNYVAFKLPMKRLIPITLTLLILMNVMGYYVLLVGLEYNTRKDLVRRFDRGTYNRDEVVTLKIPLSMPYGITESGYERVDGEFEYQGEYYRLIKQRFSNDTLFVICLKDMESTQINQQLTDYVKTFTDQKSDSKHTGKISINISKDFLPPGFAISRVCDGWRYNVSGEIPEDLYYSITASILSPPPRA